MGGHPLHSFRLVQIAVSDGYGLPTGVTRVLNALIAGRKAEAIMFRLAKRVGDFIGNVGAAIFALGLDATRRSLAIFMIAGHQVALDLTNAIFNLSQIRHFSFPSESDGRSRLFEVIAVSPD